VSPGQAERERQALLRLAGSLLAARERSKLSQRAVERATGYSHSMLCCWERGRNVPPVVALVRLAHLYGMDIGALVSGINRKSTGARRGSTVAA
jgi:transcriptional regulator with XRE-family HTH domain